MISLTTCPDDLRVWMCLDFGEISDNDENTNKQVLKTTNKCHATITRVCATMREYHRESWLRSLKENYTTRNQGKSRALETLHYVLRHGGGYMYGVYLITAPGDRSSGYSP